MPQQDDRKGLENDAPPPDRERGAAAAQWRASGVRPVRPLALALFRRWIAKRRLRRQFRAVRLAFAQHLPPPQGAGKLVFYLNHPSWWDPLLCIVLAPRFIPGRHFYAPIEAEQLKRYGVLRHFGLFPVELGTPRAAAQFLRAATAVLRSGNVLGLTPQGAFTDAHTRPLAFKPGMGALMERMERAGEQVTAVPVALEYVFWNQRLPEALVAIGKPLRTASIPKTSIATSTVASPATDAAEQQPAPRSAAQWTAVLEAALAQTQDALAQLSAAREEGAFETVLQGRRGAAGVYGLWQRLFRRESADHVPTSKPLHSRAKK